MIFNFENIFTCFFLIDEKVFFLSSSPKLELHVFGFLIPVLGPFLWLPNPDKKRINGQNLMANNQKRNRGEKGKEKKLGGGEPGGGELNQNCETLNSSIRIKYLCFAEKFLIRD